jgi:hypothetical protein
LLIDAKIGVQKNDAVKKTSLVRNGIVEVEIVRVFDGEASSSED